MIYQLVKKRTEILPLAISHFKPIDATSLIMFALPISMPRLKSIDFFQNRGLKLSYLCKNNARFSSDVGSAPRPPN